VISSYREEIADGLYRVRFRGVYDLSRTESSGLVEALRLDVNNNDPRRSSDARAADSVEPNPSCAEDDDRVPSAYLRGVQDRTSARYTAAAEESSLGERKFLGYDGELVFVDQRAFGEAAQPKALEKGGAVTAQAWGIARSA